MKEAMEDMQGSDTLCEHCFCTEYGLSMNAMHVSATSSGCEGSYCAEAYQHYLDEEDDE